MKTPEEMAMEYRFGEFPDTNSDTFLAAVSAYKAFLAGYKAAQDQLADTSKVMFCVYCNDTHKGDCAPGKGKNHPALNAKWISVKDRLPKIASDRFVSDEVLWISTYGEMHVSCLEKLRSELRVDWGEAGLLKLDQVTHWQPLPEAPKEEK